MKNKVIQMVVLSSFLYAIFFWITESSLSYLPAIIIGIGCSFASVKVDLIGFASTSVTWYISVLNINTGLAKGKNTYNLLFISHDFIGWRFELFFISFNDSYDKKYNEYRQEVMLSKPETEKFSERIKKAMKNSNNHA